MNELIIAIKRHQSLRIEPIGAGACERVGKFNGGTDHDVSKLNSGAVFRVNLSYFSELQGKP